MMTDESLNLWFDSSDEDKTVLEKIKSPKKVVSGKSRSKNNNLSERLINVQNQVYKILGKHVQDTQVITTKEELIKYIDKAIINKIIAVDTETNNTTETVTCKLMGACLYTYNEKQVYIPINHVDINTREKLSNQLTEEDLREEFQRLIDNDVKIVMHNASFDIRVIQCTCNIELPIYWDTQIGCRILDENESTQDKSNLKYQYMLHVDSTHGKYDIESLFDNLDYAIISPEVFALYAATDSFMTLKLYDYQKSEFEKEGNEKIFKLFKTEEIPLIKTVKDIELRGIKIDEEYLLRLKEKYYSQLNKVEHEIAEELKNLQTKIDVWRLTPEANEKQKSTKGDKLGKSKSEQLETPINLGSPVQFAILLYDVLKVESVNKESPRSTSEDTIKLIYDKTNLKLCKLLIERRNYTKIISSYIDNIFPLLEIWPDKRIRVGFNQCGTDTGRFTSGGKIKFMKNNQKIEISGVNLQTIPSHNKEIRMLYCADKGKVIVGSDYSAQEPRLTAFMSQEESMLQAYREGKDLYSVIASMCFDTSYEDCLEFYPEGKEIEIDGKKVICGYKTHQNKEGKERRSQAKSVLLGLEYGRGATSIGEQIGKTKLDAQKIIDNFFKSFPKVEKWINETHKKVRQTGYVEDWYGRRRRLPNIMLPNYLIELKNKDKNELDNFNPFLICENRTNSVFDKKKKSYEEKLSLCKYSSQVSKIIQEAAKENIFIRSNSNLIAEAERQSVNAIIQGGAATLTKLAMINIDKDEKLNELGFKLLSTIHDEVFGECPEENAQEVAKRLTQVMIDTAKPYMNVPMSCDAYIVKHWYEDEYKATLLKEYKDYEDSGLSKEESLDKLIKNHTESTKDFIVDLLKEV